MDIKEIVSKVDHTLLNTDCTWEQIRQLCDDGARYSAASVCIPPSFVKRAKAHLGDRLKICTVIGFPNGYATGKAKVFETEDAIENGADEIDMVINIGALREGNLTYVENEIMAVREVCHNRLLKVIIEACLLTDEEKVTMCKIVTKTGADYIKTSTGFSKGGATFSDVRLLAENIGPNVKIKAAGGISSLEDAAEFLRLGCSRLGSSRIINIIKGVVKDEY
ncbi:MAG: deoxyribose-phosphate aldolase [Clostridiales bacterium]|nr:deoxyribose-phosphate aldolase [Clostridiales bacterium]